MKLFGVEILEQDVVEGFVYGIFSVFAIGPFAIPAAAVTALLWALGGAGFLGLNSWRRIGCPAVMASIFYFTGHPLALGSGILQWGALSIGYGIPSVQPPDEGSELGRFWFERFGHDKKTDVATQISWFAILALAMAPMFIK